MTKIPDIFSEFETWGLCCDFTLLMSKIGIYPEDMLYSDADYSLMQAWDEYSAKHIPEHK